MDVLKLVIDYVKAKSGQDEVVVESVLEDLGLDEIDIVDVIMEAEETLSLPEIADEALSDLKTVADVVKAVKGQVAAVKAKEVAPEPKPDEDDGTQDPKPEDDENADDVPPEPKPEDDKTEE